MKSKFVAATVVAIVALSGVGAFAQTNVQNRLEGEASTRVSFDTTSSQLTRAQVQAEYFQARQKGELPASPEVVFTAAPAAATSLTRAEVRAEAVVSAHTAQAISNSAL